MVTSVQLIKFATHFIVNYKSFVPAGSLAGVLLWQRDLQMLRKNPLCLGCKPPWNSEPRVVTAQSQVNRTVETINLFLTTAVRCLLLMRAMQSLEFCAVIVSEAHH